MSDTPPLDLDAIRRRIALRRYYGKTIPVDADDLDALLRHIEELRHATDEKLTAENTVLRVALNVRHTGGMSLPPSSTEARVERARTVAWLRAVAGQLATHANLVGPGISEVWHTIAALVESREPERWTHELHEHED